jgi:2-amino-4,5-dihydroxy-6-oxo-7-(phosphooxy)heptanoate synthase
VPDVPPGERRVEAVNRVVAAVGVPVLFLGGPHMDGAEDRVLNEVREVMAGGGAGLAIGRAVFREPSPAGMASQLAGIVHAA